MAATSEAGAKFCKGILFTKSRSGIIKMDKVIVEAKPGQNKNHLKCRLKKVSMKPSRIPVLVKNNESQTTKADSDTNNNYYMKSLDDIKSMDRSKVSETLRNTIFSQCNPLPLRVQFVYFFHQEITGPDQPIENDPEDEELLSANQSDAQIKEFLKSRLRRLRPDESRVILQRARVSTISHPYEEFDGPEPLLADISEEEIRPVPSEKGDVVESEESLLGKLKRLEGSHVIVTDFAVEEPPPKDICVHLSEISTDKYSDEEEPAEPVVVNQPDFCVHTDDYKASGDYSDDDDDEGKDECKCKRLRTVIKKVKFDDSCCERIIIASSCNSSEHNVSSCGSNVTVKIKI